MEHARRVTSSECGHDTDTEIHNAAGDSLEEYIKLALMAKFPNTVDNGAVCKYCHKKSVTIALIQTRSADEGMTARATCHNPRCARTWTVH